MQAQLACVCERGVLARARPQRAHWAKVTSSAPVAARASRTSERSHSGAWSAMRGHQAGPSELPQSAGFSRAHGTLA
eukprot:6199570-Pleurochrysis_carterae.AAC.2